MVPLTSRSVGRIICIHCSSSIRSIQNSVRNWFQIPDSNWISWTLGLFDAHRHELECHEIYTSLFVLQYVA